MSDQAEALRALVRRGRLAPGTTGVAGSTQAAPGIHTIAVSSGKGGVGKTSVAINVGLALSQLGKRVLLLDADLGLANIDVLLGIRTSNHLGMVLAGERSIQEIIQQVAATPSV